MVEEPRKATDESDADSEAFTQEREQAAKEKFEAQRENDTKQFAFLGVPEPEVDVPDPKERVGLDTFSDAEREAYERQVEVASDGYSPKSVEEFKSESTDAPDISPDANEFQLTEEAPDHSGPKAADEAARTGVNPRSAATASDREGMEQESDQVAPVSENAEPVSKSSPKDNPRRVE